MYIPTLLKIEILLGRGNNSVDKIAKLRPNISMNYIAIFR